MKGLRVDVRVVRALVKRDLRMYFSNPTGYVFITLFIFLSAAAAFWQERFFLDNLANLDQLNGLFPYLLLFFVPALTMGVWSEERKLGTDELLLTLPASDLEVILGKYLATLAVYTVSLVLSVSHVLVLLWLGSPDLGLMIGNYLGYWLIGSALIAVGMLASMLTDNATIAYILGAIACGVFVFIDSAVSLFSERLGRLLSLLGVSGHFGDFARGVVSLTGIIYFLSVVGFFLFLNVMMIQRRHWPRAADGYPMWLHGAVRAAALSVALIALGAVAGRAAVRLDVTAEGLHSLTDETRDLIGELSADRPVFIQAYVSPEAPEAYVQTRSNLLGILAEIDSIAGGRVEVLIHDTEPYTDAAREARETFGITARQVPVATGARAGFADLFLGIAVTCGAEEEVIPFFDRGLPIEYEIARSMRVVARTERKKIGVVGTQMKLFGGMDFQTFRSTPPWPVVDELKKQYEVVQISAGTPITEKLDGLLVGLPSSLTQEEIDNVVEAIEAGLPALILDDPLPIVDIGLSPSERAGADRNPFMQQGPPPEPKGNIQDAMARLGIRWNPAEVVWDSYNPHPEFAQLPPEVVFVGAGNESEEAFNARHGASGGLQEVVLLYPGHIEKAADSPLDFVPLLRTGKLSGRLPYHQMVQHGFLGMTQLNRNLPHRPEAGNYILAAHVRSAGVDLSGPGEKGSGDEGAEEAAASGSEGGVNLIVVADLDFISSQFFEIRKMGDATLNFDNISFFLNCMDILVGDESFIDLRNRRVRHRTLTRVEERTRRFIEQRAEDEKQAELEAEKALREARSRLEGKVDEVRQRPDLDSQTKQIMARNLEEVENRRFEVLQTNIELEKEAAIQRSKEIMEEHIRGIQSGIRTFAVMLPPVPVFILGVAIFMRRRRLEREGAAAARRLRG